MVFKLMSVATLSSRTETSLERIFLIIEGMLKAFMTEGAEYSIESTVSHEVCSGCVPM